MPKIRSKFTTKMEIILRVNGKKWFVYLAQIPRKVINWQYIKPNKLHWLKKLIYLSRHNEAHKNLPYVYKKLVVQLSLLTGFSTKDQLILLKTSLIPSNIKNQHFWIKDPLGQFLVWQFLKMYQKGFVFQLLQCMSNMTNIANTVTSNRSLTSQLMTNLDQRGHPVE